MAPCRRAPKLAIAATPRRATASARPRGGVATQRTANPCTPVRFRARPPDLISSARPSAPPPTASGAPMAQAISSDDLAARRQRMVDGQLRTCDVTDQALLAAFARIPRESFVAPAFASLAYLDREVPALGASDRLLLAPMVLAKLIQAANVR